MDDDARWTHAGHGAIARLLTKGFEGPLSAEDESALDALVATTPGGNAFADAFIDNWMIAGIAGREPPSVAQDAIDAAPLPLPASDRTQRVRLAAAGLAAAAMLSAGGAWLWRTGPGSAPGGSAPPIRRRSSCAFRACCAGMRRTAGPRRSKHRSPSG